MTGRAARTVLALAVAGLFAAATARDALGDWIARTDLPAVSVATGVEVLDREGRLLRAFTVADGRWRLDPGPVDPLFIAMLLAYEDHRFRDHAGVDPRALARALWQALRQGRVISGGSTLTMQVARLIEAGGTGRLSGKLRQIRVALALERRLSKDRILDLYLRLAPYGGNVEGLRAATLTWFGKEPRRLTPAEAAFLVALPQSPESRRPDRFPEAAVRSRARVLEQMVTAGVLDPATAGAALSEPVPTKRRDFPALAALLAGRLRAADPGAHLIRTTIDTTLQAPLEHLAAATAAAAATGPATSVAILVADHRSGAILASVGAAAWADDARGGYLDMTQAHRSPGSTLKPFVYGLAFDEGLAHPETLIEDRPVAFGRYAPQNFDGRYRGTISLRESLQLSLNIPVLRLTEALGPARLMTALRVAGAAPRLPAGRPPGLAVALGGLGISLQDLVQAYAALARLGRPIRLSARQDEAGPLPGRLFSPEAAWLVADILAGLPPPPGAARDRLAYKTGTSYGHRDAWALGFDGHHVAGVWIGRPDGTPVPGAFGGDLAAPVLFEVFGRIKPAADPLPPPPPATLILPHARLPLPLQRFRPRDAVFAAAGADAPELAFPPDGATVETAATLALKVRGGTPPFTWLANGRPVVLRDPAREATIPAPGAGYVSLSVIDADGRRASAEVRLVP